MATEAQRLHVRSVLDLLHAHAAQLAYPPGDVRTTLDNACWHWSELTLETMLHAGHYWQGDCSEFGSYVLKLAGCWPWPSPGYTGSHLASLPVYTNAKAARIGALVVFGPGTGHHEAVVYQPDPRNGNPLLSSHGRAGFDQVRLRDLEAEQTRDGHPGVRFCSIAHL